MPSLNCDLLLRRSIQAHLRDFPFRAMEIGTGEHAAAVALTVVPQEVQPNLPGVRFEAGWQNQAAFILTLRSARLKKHAGQWALPGGRIDAGETPEQTALRELEEEVGLRLDQTAVLGRLDDYRTRSGFTIKPVVLWGGPIEALVANPDEVAAIYRVPLAELMREDAPMLESIPESPYPVLKMPLGDSWIAAPTAALLYQFREVCISGVHTRVAHFEQPYFAWK